MVYSPPHQKLLPQISNPPYKNLKREGTVLHIEFKLINGKSIRKPPPHLHNRICILQNNLIPISFGLSPRIQDYTICLHFDSLCCVCLLASFKNATEMIVYKQYEIGPALIFQEGILSSIVMSQMKQKCVLSL